MLRRDILSGGGTVACNVYAAAYLLRHQVHHESMPLSPRLFSIPATIGAALTAHSRQTSTASATSQTVAHQAIQMQMQMQSWCLLHQETIRAQRNESIEAVPGSFQCLRTAEAGSELRPHTSVQLQEAISLRLRLGLGDGGWDSVSLSELVDLSHCS